MTKKEWAKAETELRQTIESLNADIVKLKEALRQSHNRWVEEAQQNGKHIGDGMKISKFERQFEVLTLIAEGKQLEAMQALLRTDVMLFNTKIVIADDATRVASDNELLERCKSALIESVKAVKFTPKEISS